MSGHFTLLFGIVPCLPILSEVFLFLISTLFYAFFILKFIEKNARTKKFYYTYKVIVSSLCILMILDIILKAISIQFSFFFYEISRPIIFIVMIRLVYLMNKIKTPLSKYAVIASSILLIFSALALVIKYIRVYEWSGIIYRLTNEGSLLTSTV